MDLVIFEEAKPLVCEALENGEFDYIEAASEVFETDFFRFLKAEPILMKLAETYPTPRKKEEVPLLFYVASNLSLRLHGVHAFNAFPMLVRAGGMLNAFGPQMGKKVTHPDTGQVTISCEGFNNKNHYDRQTPCDHDYLRKVARDTRADKLMGWFGHDVVRIFRSRRAFDKEGLFLGDASYLFVPDNPNYEGSARLLFDEHHHPISSERYEKMSDEQKVRCQWRRCYKMVTLLHTNRSLDFFLFVGVKVLSGKENECPVLYELVGQFVEAVGKGVMKRLILDRGFLDGEAISTCKKDYEIDILIPVRHNMDIYEDAMALFRLPDVDWARAKEPEAEPKELPRPRPKALVKREEKRQERLQELRRNKPAPLPEETVIKREAAAIGEFRSWSSCTVPLTVVANRELYADGHEETWLLIDTREVKDPCRVRDEYHLRTATEERFRQLKCFSDLTHFTSRAFSLVVNQTVFIMLAYNLLQFYLLRQGKKKLNKKPLPYIRQQLLPSDNHVIVYWQNYYGLFKPFELVGFVAELSEEARKKIAEKCRRIGRELTEIMKNPRAP
jgi:hypothetical protein